MTDKNQPKIHQPEHEQTIETRKPAQPAPQNQPETDSDRDARQSREDAARKDAKK